MKKFKYLIMYIYLSEHQMTTIERLNVKKNSMYDYYGMFYWNHYLNIENSLNNLCARAIYKSPMLVLC